MDETKGIIGEITIVLADDHPVVRQGLRALLESEKDFRVIGEAGDGLEAVRVVERLKPRVLIVDLTMPGLSGLEVTRQVSRRFPETHILVLSIHANEAYVLQALRNGAAGYLLKDSSTTDLVRAVLEVASDRRYLSPPLSQHAIEAYVQKGREEMLDTYEMLTTREREVLQLAAEGYSNSEIGARLFISPRTAETHRGALMKKLGLKNQTDVIRYALRRGILSND
jgi:DNA-binding NarL/FixJ family response regulator